jgi:hypothetical protein
MIVLLVLLGWIGLSLPVGLLTGMAIRRGQRPIPAHLIELPPEELAPVPAGTRG